LADVALATKTAPGNECFCLKHSSEVFVALITMHLWTKDEKVCDFEGVKHFLSFDRLLLFLGPQYIRGKGSLYGVEPRGEKKVRCSRDVSFYGAGYYHLAKTTSISIPVHGVRANFDNNPSGLRFCGDIFNLEGIGTGKGEFTPFPDVTDTNEKKIKEIPFRAVYDLCHDGLEPLYVYE
jgi:hypothetical protein